LYVLLNLFGQFADIVKFHLIPDPIDEINAYLLSVYVFVKIDDVDLNSKLAIIKGGAESDICNGLEAVSLPFNGNGIDAVFGAEFVLEIDVCRGASQQFPPPGCDRLRLSPGSGNADPAVVWHRQPFRQLPILG